MRNNVTPIVFCSNLRLEFQPVTDNLTSDITNTEYDRVQVRYSGKDEEGKTRNYTEKLWSIGYGQLDWAYVEMALREFVSNAIDHTIMYNHHHGNSVDYPWEGVTIELVNENQVRAKTGTTRVFIPASVPAVRSFFVDLGKWFMHFSEPENIPSNILRKQHRNMGDKTGPVFYRRGVRVGELEHTNLSSLFDYNFDIKVDESRNLNEYNAKSESARVLASSDTKHLSILLRSFDSEVQYWEHSFDKYYMSAQYIGNKEEKETRSKNWQFALQTLGVNRVISCNSESDTIRRKGYTPLIVPEGFFETAQSYEVTTSDKILSQDERLGREVYPASLELQELAIDIWAKIVEVGMDTGKPMPDAFRFSSIMSADSTCYGFYRDGGIYLNTLLGDANTPQLRTVIIEEYSHYITGATDQSRDLQDWAFNFAAKLIG
jgi:hypothetical protein